MHAYLATICRSPGAADFESRIQRWAFCVRVSLGRCPRLTWTGAFGAKQILSHWDRVGEALTYLSSWNQTEAPVAAVYDRRRRSESAATADRANAHAAAPVVFDARVRLSRSAVGRTRPMARATAVIDRRYRGTDGGHRPPLQQIAYERFLFAQCRNRFFDLVAAKFVERHIWHDFPFAAAVRARRRTNPSGWRSVGLSRWERRTSLRTATARSARAVAAVYDRRRRLVHFSK